MGRLLDFEEAQRKVDQDLETWNLHLSPKLRDRIASTLVQHQKDKLPPRQNLAYRRELYRRHHE